MYHGRIVDEDEDVNKLIEGSKAILQKSRDLNLDMLGAVGGSPMKNNYKSESPLGNFMCDTMRHYSEKEEEII